jgi:hypothetical protein
MSTDRPMLAFVDFEASSLDKRSYPIEVGWVLENGRAESMLIRPERDWTDWSDAAEALHGISRCELVERGLPVAEVAARIVRELSAHDPVASAPSWDGKWLSRLLRSGGQPRHALRLRSTGEARREAVGSVLARALSGDALAQAVDDVLALHELRFSAGRTVHRALADAVGERERWLAVRDDAMRWLCEMSAA